MPEKSYLVPVIAAQRVPIRIALHNLVLVAIVLVTVGAAIRGFAAEAFVEVGA